MEGQLWPEERKFLYNAVVECDPMVVLEVGTWKGGGSTLTIATALHDLHNSSNFYDISMNKTLYTCEVDNELYTTAINQFAGSKFSRSVKFHNIPSTELIKHLIASYNIPQFVFFDGPEDPQLNLDDFKLLDEYLLPGSYFCMHDWDLEVRPDSLTSCKATYLRPYLENSKNWQILRSLTAPVSVGIVLARKF